MADPTPKGVSCIYTIADQSNQVVYFQTQQSDRHAHLYTENLKPDLTIPFIISSTWSTETWNTSRLM